MVDYPRPIHIYMLTTMVGLPHTLWAKAFEHIVGRMEVEAFGKIHLRNGQTAETEGAVAFLAIKMRVQVGQSGMDIFSTMATFSTEGIFNLPRAIVNAMDEVVLQEKGKRSEDARLVNRSDTPLQIRQRKGALGIAKGANHQKTNRRRLDAAMNQLMLIAFRCIRLFFARFFNSVHTDGKGNVFL
mgnify:FL=1